MKLLLIAAATLLSIAGVAVGQRWGGGGCANGSCSPGLVSPYVPAPDYYEWRAYRDGDERGMKLMRNGEQIGYYWFPDATYYAAGGRLAAPPITPPLVPQKFQKVAKKKADGCGCNLSCDCDPEKCRCHEGGPCPDDCCIPQQQPMQNFGNDYIAPKDGGTHYYLNNEMVQRGDVTDAMKSPVVIGGPSLPDDSAKGWIVIIGDKSETNPVAADLRSNARLKSVLTGFHLKEYSRDHWKVKKEKYDTSGKPTIYKFAKDGKYDPAKDMWTEYRGADWLADEMDRRNPPAPQPAPHVDPPPTGPNAKETDYTPHICFGCLGAAAVVLMMKRKKE